MDKALEATLPLVRVPIKYCFPCKPLLLVQSGNFAAAAAGRRKGRQLPSGHGREEAARRPPILRIQLTEFAYFFGLHFWTDWEPLVEPSANRVTAELTHFLWHRAIT